MAVYRKLNTKEEIVNRIQDNTAKTVSQINQSTFSGGTILSGQELSSGDNTINHKLGKNLTGWFIVRQRGSASIYDKQDDNKTPSQTLVLNASADVSVDIFVF